MNEEFPADSLCNVCGETYMDENGLPHASATTVGHDFEPKTTTDSLEALRDDDGEIVHVPFCGCVRCTGGRHQEGPTYYAE